MIPRHEIVSTLYTVMQHIDYPAVQLACQSICIWWWWVVNGQCIFTAQLWRNRLRVTFGCHLFAIFSWLFAFPFAFVTCVHCFFAIFLWLHIPKYLFQNMDICLSSLRICLKQISIFPKKLLSPFCRLAVPTHLCPNFTYLWNDQRIEHRCENVKTLYSDSHINASKCIISR